MDKHIIVSHTKIGKAFPHCAQIFLDEQDFVQCVRDTQTRDEQPVSTIQNTSEYVQKASKVIVKVITQDTYVIGEAECIDRKADKLGWNGGVK